MTDNDTELPNSVQKKFEVFESSLNSIQDTLKPFLKMPIVEVREQLEDPLENARIDLMVAYTTNSLFWTYLITQGIDPKTHPVKDELLRIKKYFGKIQAVQDKKKMAKIDTYAAKRFVRNALWEPSKEEGGSSKKDANESEEPAVDAEEEKKEEEDVKKSKKRKKQQEDNTQKKKKKKKKK